MIGPLLAATLVAVPGPAHTHLEAVEKYRRREPGAIEAVARVAEGDVRRELDAMRRLARSRRRLPPEDAALAAYPFEAAVLAHTELAFRADDAGEPNVAQAEQAMARDFLEAGGERVVRLAPRWHLLVGLRHLERLRLPEAEQALQEGAGTFPADSRLWLAAGAVAQAAARFTPPEARAVAMRPAHVKQRMRAIADRRALRMEAQMHFERALQQEAGLHEAAIRLAEVRLALGRPQEACDALSALPDEIETVLSYVAHLMRGRCQEKLERWPSAIESYRRATALWPAAETGWLALARALDHVGDRGGSQVALARVFASDRSPSARDPFRLFPVFCSGGSEALWGALLEGLR